MGRFYSINVAGVAVSAAQDLFEILAGSGKPFYLHEIVVGQTSDFGDAAAEGLGVRIKRATSGYTSGSGGSTPTPAKHLTSDSASGATAASPPLLPATGITGFTLKANTVTRSATIARSGTVHVVLTPATPIYKTDVVTVSYAPGNVTDSAATPNALASFTDSAVTNNSQLNLPPTLDTATPGDALVTLGWTYPTVTSGEFDLYKSTDGINFSIATVLSDYTLRTRVVSGLTNGTPYYFRIVFQDDTGSSDPSNRLGPVTPTDTTAPVISGVSAGSPGPTSVTIGWGTNEVSDSQVEYGLTTGYGSSTTLDTSLVTFHSVGLTGLSAGTLYHYRVKSRDAAGNLATGTDNTFTTAAAPDVIPPVISGVSSGSLTTTGATVSWTTDESADSQVEYGLTTSYGSTTTLDTTLATSHSVGLTGLTAGTTYHYRVLSADATGNLATGTDHTFATVAETAPDAVVTYSADPDLDNWYGDDNVTAWADLNDNADATEITARKAWARGVAYRWINSKLRGADLTAPATSSNFSEYDLLPDIEAERAGAILYQSRGVTEVSGGIDGITVIGCPTTRACLDGCGVIL
jgi:hypothetical protein